MPYSKTSFANKNVNKFIFVVRCTAVDANLMLHSGDTPEAFQLKNSVNRKMHYEPTFFAVALGLQKTFV